MERGTVRVNVLAQRLEPGKLDLESSLITIPIIRMYTRMEVTGIRRQRFDLHLCPGLSASIV